MIVAEGFTYEIIEDYREAFKEEAFLDRYSEILTKYDYIMGDWGYGQLRLKGFFEDRSHKATFDTKIGTMKDYLYEYCNFGCAYFVVKKIGIAPKIVPDEAIIEVNENLEQDQL
ncbi:YutD family protein [Psychrobacillus antarcticus]|uniref:YutD family protein n=1 Tax=Psychrobacillus antarcticus TaxID=2879115 RepID=UPI0024084428|nr:YutD family protein [Psychrobacillus antarcticus]